MWGREEGNLLSWDECARRDIEAAAFLELSPDEETRKEIFENKYAQNGETFEECAERLNILLKDNKGNDLWEEVGKIKQISTTKTQRVRFVVTSKIQHNILDPKDYIMADRNISIRSDELINSDMVCRTKNNSDLNMWLYYNREINQYMVKLHE